MIRNHPMDHGDETHLFHSRVKTHDKRTGKLDRYKGDTIYEDDYKFYAPEKRRMYKWPKDKCYYLDKTHNKPYVQTNQETFAPYKPDARIPFNLHWQPKPIIGTYPEMKFIQQKDIIDHNFKLAERVRLEVMRTRPRINISPAVKVDDIQDEQVRRTIMSSMYDSDWKRSTRVAVENTYKGNFGYPASTSLERHQIHFSVDNRLQINAQLRRQAGDWDKIQEKESVDPTLTFWLNKELKEDDIFATEKRITKETKDEIRELIEEDKLRIQHDLTMPDYNGFHARVPYGIALRKNNLSVNHPNVSVSQAITARYAKEDLAQRNAYWQKSGFT